jgi:undecaprenyl-diphosphatase
LGLIESIALGIVQGLTEFLPISSSGHLVIVERLFGIKSSHLVFEVLVHLGTLLAVVVYFRKRLFIILRSVCPCPAGGPDVTTRNRKYFWFLILGTIPAALVGFFLEDYIEQAFASPRWTSGMLLVTAAVLLATRLSKRQDRKLNSGRTLFIGIAQALAIMPGISRSGSTISAGMYVGLEKSEAAEFSFLLSIPAILGATVLKMPDYLKTAGDPHIMVNYIAGAVTAAAVGYLSIACLMAVIRKGKFFWFGIYCAAVGILGILIL